MKERLICLPFSNEMNQTEKALDQRLLNLQDKFMVSFIVHVIEIE
jgi:hypothetical protein